MTKEKKTVTLKEVDELLSSNLSEEKFDMMKSNINKDELDLFKALVTIDQLGVFRINKDEYDNWKDEYDNWFDMPKLQLMELLGIDSRNFELYLLHLAAFGLVIFKRVEYEDEYGETIPYVVYRVNREIIKEYL